MYPACGRRSTYPQTLHVRESIFPSMCIYVCARVCVYVCVWRGGTCMEREGGEGGRLAADGLRLGSGSGGGGGGIQPGILLCQHVCGVQWEEMDLHSGTANIFGARRMDGRDGMRVDTCTNARGMYSGRFHCCANTATARERGSEPERSICTSGVVTNPPFVRTRTSPSISTYLLSDSITHMYKVS